MNATNALEASSLCKRYGRTRALDGCTLAVPAGSVVALVGPNGAGKTTLLHLAVGLTSPTSGTVTVLDGVVPGSLAALQRVGFVAQDTPLYRNLSVDDTLRFVANLSATWDEATARGHLARLEIPPDRKVGHLSGGQQAQVSLTVALARHPDLLVLDEPVARLDPLARHDFMAVLMAAVAEEGISVLFSSHVVAELQRVSDYLVVLNHGRVQVAGDVEELLDTHCLLTGPSVEAPNVATSHAVVQSQESDRQTRLLTRTPPGFVPPPGWAVGPTNLEELVLAYLRSRSATALPGPRSSSGADIRATA